jgi:hypothetical protein
MRKGLLTLPVAQPTQNAEAILKTHQLFICGDMPYIVDEFCKKKGTRWRHLNPGLELHFLK